MATRTRIRPETTIPLGLELDRWFECLVKRTGLNGRCKKSLLKDGVQWWLVRYDTKKFGTDVIAEHLLIIGREVFQ